MSKPSTFDLSDALALATYSNPSWNDDGTYVAYERTSSGDTAFVARPVEQFSETALSLNASSEDLDRFVIDDSVSDHAWRPGEGTEVAVIADGRIEIVDVSAASRTPLVEAPADHSSLAWHPAGGILAYVRDGSLWLHNVVDGNVHEVSDRIAGMFGPTPVEWSESGDRLATLTETDAETLALSVFAPFDADEDAMIAFRFAPSPKEEVVTDTFDWAGETLVFARDSLDGTTRQYCVADLSMEPRKVDYRAVLSEHDDQGLAAAVIVGHASGKVALVSPTTGHHHVYVLDVTGEFPAESEPLSDAASGMTQVTSGEFEARGDAKDAPAWDEGGDRLAYVTNEVDRGERRLHVASFKGITLTETTAFDEVDGNAVYPTWGSGRLVCLRAGTTTPADVHVFDPERSAVRRVSVAHPSPEVFERFPSPEPVSFESSTDGKDIYGYLYTPQGCDSDDQPAVVWAHGGPSRQMRRGFHHMGSYATFHAFNQLLVERGYTVLELNYRGGIGYGREYELGIFQSIGETDVTDCVDAAAYLRDRDDVGDRIGFWGLSYGGFLANAVATKTDAYDCAVNFAGIWDWRDWMWYATGRNWSAARRFLSLFGGRPDSDDESVLEQYRVASPCEYVEGIDTPLFVLHGTDDPNVPFDQMDAVVNDLVAHGAEFEMAYYPDEDHMFQEPETWRDTIGRVLPFFETHL